MAKNTRFQASGRSFSPAKHRNASFFVVVFSLAIAISKCESPKLPKKYQTNKLAIIILPLQLHMPTQGNYTTMTKLITTAHAHERYGTHFVCVCVC